MDKKVTVIEACPRDGWQNHKVIIPLETKLAYVKKMIAYGARKLDVTSFVNPKLVLQMAGAKELMQALQAYAAEKNLDVELMALALNKRGAEDAIAAGAKSIQFVLSVSEEHNLRNSHCSISQSLEGFKAMASEVKGVTVTLALACAFGSPFGDEVPIDRIKQLCQAAFEIGVNRIGLADTAGISSPTHTRELLRKLKADFDLAKFSVHLHDSRGMGLVNAFVAVEEGIRSFDSSLGGMGGCPFVPRAKGNIATEDLVNMLHAMGYETGYDLNQVIVTALEMGEAIGAEINTCLTKVGTCNL